MQHLDGIVSHLSLNLTRASRALRSVEAEAGGNDERIRRLQVKSQKLTTDLQDFDNDVTELVAAKEAAVTAFANIGDGKKKIVKDVDAFESRILPIAPPEGLVRISSLEDKLSAYRASVGRSVDRSMSSEFDALVSSFFSASLHVRVDLLH